MKTMRHGVVGVLLLFCVAVYGEVKRSQTQPLSPENVPVAGNFYSFQAEASDRPWPPLPFNPFQGSAVPVYALGGNRFLYDDSGIDYGGLLTFTRASRDLSSVLSQSTVLTALTMSLPFPGDEEEPGGSSTNAPVDTRRNFEKFMGQAFSLVDTNDAANNDTNLYNACVSFPDDTNAVPTLQIKPYGTNAILIRANHFDYSDETNGDFALIVCDSVDKPIWKNIDLLGESDSQDGWLVQGIVLSSSVTDPMYLMVTNIARDCNAFFRAIPYAGPQPQLGGYSAFDVVSGTVTFNTTATDLSGVRGVRFALDVDGIEARYSVCGSNTITLDTRYNWGGWETVNFTAFSSATVYDLTNCPSDNAKLLFAGRTSLPLYFDNEIFLAYASDEASLDIGQNDIDFYATTPVTYAATIQEPDSGRTLKSFSGSASPGYIYLVWNFTEQDGTTPYTNDTYAVAFTATSSNETNSLSITNKIDDGVRHGAGCFLTYQEEDPNDANGSVLNQEADTWIRQTLRLLYTDQYKPLSLTQYTTSQVGTNRNHANCIPLSDYVPHWADFMPINLTNKNYSDLTLAQAHGDGFTIGYSKAYLNDKFTPYDLHGWLGDTYGGKKWRLRKVAFWTCWSGADTGDWGFWQACGIRPEVKQMTTYCTKNAGLFFRGGLPQVWITGGQVITTAKAAAFFDQAFICGNYPWPGACDPTYSIRWAAAMTLNEYPEMNVDPRTGRSGVSQPWLYGCRKLIDTTVYDDELIGLDFSHVKEN